MLPVAGRTTWCSIDGSPRDISAGHEVHVPLSGHPMRILLNVAGVLCLLMGGIWFLQGINVLPGSFMTGQTKWAVYGGLLCVVGIGLLIVANRRPTGVGPNR